MKINIQVSHFLMPDNDCKYVHELTQSVSFLDQDLPAPMEKLLVALNSLFVRRRR